jgi:FixJ family two-component response regulator
MSLENPTVYVVDDDVSVRESLTNLFQSVGLKVEAFDTADKFLSKKPATAPSCLILDVRLPGLSGLDLQHELARTNHAIPIVFITGHGDIPMSVRAIKAGAVEFLTKPFRDQDLLDAVRQAIEGDRETRSRARELAKLRERYASLTTREQEVLQYVVRGIINKQMGAEIGISEPTVKLHRGRMMNKMGAESLADLIMMAQKLGLTGNPGHKPASAAPRP